MVPQKMAKAAGDYMNPKTDILSYTSPRAIDTVKNWMQLFDILKHDLINFPNDSGDKVTKTQETKL